MQIQHIFDVRYPQSWISFCKFVKVVCICKIKSNFVSTLRRKRVNSAWLNPHLSNIKGNLHCNNKQQIWIYDRRRTFLWSFSLFLQRENLNIEFLYPIKRKNFLNYSHYTLERGPSSSSCHLIFTNLSSFLTTLNFWWIIHSTSLLFIIQKRFKVTWL